ncbi:hypothetical protein [Ancylobacter dichloromethanicus]|uniref:Uncharacterized protein n=1 Tax=Ancylobacter dichloromethanicus TaxID=518825 RepID=A0A9W6JF60_9HYPH|nr:hypothetical protein [Ancylobacter dichloromethanicus]GLK74690.1 hypothetical protein GCM10017643_48090 [Ancylobacter dichloromethanicus]
MNPADWRAVAGRVSATFSTPLPAVMAMFWDDVLLWFHEARDIDRERWAPLRLLAERAFEGDA